MTVFHAVLGMIVDSIVSLSSLIPIADSGQRTASSSIVSLSGSFSLMRLQRASTSGQTAIIKSTDQWADGDEGLARSFFSRLGKETFACPRSRIAQHAQ